MPSTIHLGATHHATRATSAGYQGTTGRSGGCQVDDADGTGRAPAFESGVHSVNNVMCQACMSPGDHPAYAVFAGCDSGSQACVRYRLH